MYFRQGCVIGADEQIINKKSGCVIKASDLLLKLYKLTLCGQRQGRWNEPHPEGCRTLRGLGRPLGELES